MKNYKLQVVTDTHKSCSKCRELLPKESFNKDSANKTGGYLSYYCKKCSSVVSRRTYLRIKGTDQYERYVREKAYKKRFNLSFEDYQSKLMSQAICGICGTNLLTKEVRAHLDHSHITGEIRDFLCGQCNTGLGMFKENKQILEDAIKYLERFE